MTDDKIEKKTADDVFVYVNGVAEKNGWDLTHDTVTVTRVCMGMLKNYKKHGDMYCPCAVIQYGKDNSAKRCPCADAKTLIETKGYCKCRLFFSRDYKSAKD